MALKKEFERTKNCYTQDDSYDKKLYDQLNIAHLYVELRICYRYVSIYINIIAR